MCPSRRHNPAEPSRLQFASPFALSLDIRPWPRTTSASPISHFPLDLLPDQVPQIQGQHVPISLLRRNLLQTLQRRRNLQPNPWTATTPRALTFRDPLEDKSDNIIGFTSVFRFPSQLRQLQLAHQPSALLLALLNDAPPSISDAGPAISHPTLRHTKTSVNSRLQEMFSLMRGG